MVTIKKTYNLKPNFITTSTKNKFLFQNNDHDPTEDIINTDDRPSSGGGEEIYDPSPTPSTDVDYSTSAKYNISTSLKTVKKIKYHLIDENGNPEHNVDDIDDRGVIETSIDSETVIYQDEDGQYYEVSIDDLIEYDGDDGEITYHSKKIRKKPRMILSPKKSNRIKVPSSIMKNNNIRLMMLQNRYSRIYS